MDFSWIRGTLRGWTALAWWVALPVRIIAMILSIVSDLIFISIFVGIAALWMGMIPETTVRSVLDQIGYKVETYVMPEFRAALHPGAMSPILPEMAKPREVVTDTSGVDALMSSDPGKETAKKVESGK